MSCADAGKAHPHTDGHDARTAANRVAQAEAASAAAAAAADGSEQAEEYDPLRDGPLRYLGYANECGEAFAAWLPLWGVPASYAIAIAYVFVGATLLLPTH